VGGYYQAEYLPARQRAVVSAVQQSERHWAFAQKVSQVQTEAYLSGVQAVMTLAGAGALAPAGALEIIAGGGLSGKDLASIGDITVREAHLASVVDTVRDLAPEIVDSATWQKQVGVDLKRVLSRRIVLK
jgi:copper homeostasis protein CutC